MRSRRRFFFGRRNEDKRAAESDGPRASELADAPHEDHPDKPDSPTDIRKPAWSYVLRKTLREFIRDECTDLAAALTYYAVLSIFPAVIALVSILSLVGQAERTTAAVMDLVSSAAAGDAVDALGPAIETLTTAPAPGLGLFLGLATALWTASNYVNAFGRAMNRVYETDEGRVAWKLRPMMYGLTALLLVLVAIAALILAVSGPVARWVGGLVGLGDAAVTVWGIAKWPVLVAVVVVIVALLYYVTPNVRQPKMRWISPGALLAIVVAALATAGFGLYVSNFANYDASYGALAGIIIFLFWLWIMNLALLFGAEFDAELERGRQLQAGIEAEEHIQLPPRATKASDKRAKQDAEDIARGRALRESRGGTPDESGRRDGGVRPERRSGG